MKANGWFRGVAFVATTAFLWTIVVSVSPGLHQRIHADQNRGDHTCAVTFVRAGSYDYPVAPALGSVVNLHQEFAQLPELKPAWVPSPFLNAAVFEHAPPSCS